MSIRLLRRAGRYSIGAIGTLKRGARSSSLVSLLALIEALAMRHMWNLSPTCILDVRHVGIVIALSAGPMTVVIDTVIQDTLRASVIGPKVMLFVLLVLWTVESIALISLTHACPPSVCTYFLLRSPMIATSITSIFGDFSLLFLRILSLLRLS
jgi:hypothetical protein